MLEKQFIFTKTDTKKIERILEDENVGINHMVLQKGDSLPEHFSNSHVYMIVIRGHITLQLDDQNPRGYPSGSIINIPYNTKMNVSNIRDDVLEFFVVKAPSPRNFKPN